MTVAGGASVAIQKRMDGFELGVRQSDPHENREFAV